jgi:hypothetical protein
MSVPGLRLAVLLLALLLLAPAQVLAAGALPRLAPGVTAPDPPIPDDADALAQYQVLREYFERQATLDDRFPEVFSRRVRQEEAMAFLAMRETVNRRGQLERFRQARVDLGGLTFRRVTADPDLARIQVTGSYSYSVSPVLETVEEDALFVLLPEMGQWKIFERREGWR